jgi:hypothetical protein
MTDQQIKVEAAEANSNSFSASVEGSYAGTTGSASYKRDAASANQSSTSTTT